MLNNNLDFKTNYGDVPIQNLEQHLESLFEIKKFEKELKLSKKQIEEILKTNTQNKSAFQLHARIIKNIAAQVILNDDERLCDARSPLAHKHNCDEIEDVYSKDEVNSLVAQQSNNIEGFIKKTENRFEENKSKIEELDNAISKINIEEISEDNNKKYELALGVVNKISSELSVFKKEITDKKLELAKKSDIQNLNKEFEEKLKKLKTTFYSMSGGGASAIGVKNQGTKLTNTAVSIDFKGNAVSATKKGDEVTVDINGLQFPVGGNPYEITYINAVGNALTTSSSFTYDGYTFQNYGETQAYHFGGLTEAPTGSTGRGAAYGDLSIEGNDFVHTLYVYTGSGTAPHEIITRIDLAIPMPNICRVQVTPCCPDVGANAVWIDQANGSDRSYILMSGSVPLDAETLYIFNIQTGY